MVLCSFDRLDVALGEEYQDRYAGDAERHGEYGERASQRPRAEIQREKNAC